jgi:hypothetical protein
MCLTGGNVTELSLPHPEAAEALQPPEMPVVDESNLTRYPSLFVDAGGLRYTLGWQKWSGGVYVAVCRLSDLADIKVVERFPLSASGWADAWSSLVKLDARSAQHVLAILAARAAARSGVLAPPPPPRFPSSAETRRQILNAIAKGNEKYARPFDIGKIALASFVGTESWSDYGNVVLQMAILDTLLSIEEKLERLRQLPAEGAADTPFG